MRRAARECGERKQKEDAGQFHCGIKVPGGSKNTRVKVDRQPAQEAELGKNRARKGF